MMCCASFRLTQKTQHGDQCRPSQEILKRNIQSILANKNIENDGVFTVIRDAAILIFGIATFLQNCRNLVIAHFLTLNKLFCRVHQFF